MNVSRGAFFVTALLCLVACPKKDDDEEGTTAATPPATTLAPAAPAASTPAALQAEGQPTKPGIEARVKTELDGRTEGITGSALAVTGAQASLQAPSGWAITKGEPTIAASADKKAQIGAGAIGATESVTGKLPTTASALGLTNCEWNVPESVTVGKSKLAATAADGLCTRGATQVKAAYVAPLAEKLLVVGAWDPDGDSASVFGAMRSITKAGTGGGADTSGIGACCSALRQNAKSAPPDQQAGLLMAAGLCDGLKNDPQGRAVLKQVRAALAGANVPPLCQ